MGPLALLFIVVPAVELALLIEIGSHIGGLRTLLLIVVTGMVGAALAKRAGLDVLERIRKETQAGRLPAGALLDGAIILVAAALLVTPGILTDVFGFACLLPGFRGLVKQALARRLERAAAEGKIHVQGLGATPPPRPEPRRGPGVGSGPVIDVSPESADQRDRHPDHTPS